MKLEKKMLIPVFNFLAEAALTGQASRARTKLLKDIDEEVNSLQDDQKELVANYNGKINEDGLIKFESNDNKLEYEKQRQELFSEKVIFNEKTEGYFEKLRAALDNYDQKMSGEAAVAYDNVMDALEG